ncbi:response regulator transcription factor [Flavobacterium collinsii]|jgi:DNA-binding NarL/FixJ family response regulator|uniref:Oxygen regulatory protein NreC n=2 Tax=Flavobacterium collinsii TaxID=1114861 RepID=A0A9W4X4G0_9FLAO|nr:response regulator transcription factor [Flavobacterium collinsii]GIQ60636.1 DNA-binding response regulator [Flavobacterium collinsii]CAA9196641.1 Oxygen regulatory protein NreC [Flavobacterium collinsii]CAI2768416.1 Oxygen regulatory protein NreC [Flavobacterium collinsii]
MKMKSPSNNYSFLVADDHSVVRQGVSLMIKELFSNALIHKAGNFKDTLNLLKEEYIDLLILDVNFPDGNSINIIAEIKAIQPEVKILIFSAYDENIYAMRYLNAGASGYLNKETSEEEMKNAISSMISSGKYITQNVKDRILDSYISKKPTNPLDVLSNREIEVAQLLIKGYGNLEIIEHLNIKKTTVSTYKNRIFEKLEIDNLADLIKFFQLYSD